MTGPYGDERLCASLTLEELERTFFHPGPHLVRERAGPRVQKHWDEAKEVCLSCPVFLTCRDENWGQDYGVFGGTDQYERYRHRRLIQRRTLRMKPAERAELAAYFYARAGKAETLALRTGYTVIAIQTLIAEHEAVLQARRAERAAAREKAAGPRWVPAPAKWPEADPTMGDAWVQWSGKIYAAHYMAETADGGWMRLKFRSGNGTPVLRWFAAQDVEVRGRITPVIREWKRKNRVA